jgi:dihydrofolate reductase
MNNLHNLRVTAVAALCSMTRAIGLRGYLPWSFREELAHLHALTQGGTCIMGRHTWDSIRGLGMQSHPLAHTIVVTTSRQAESHHSTGSTAVVHSHEFVGTLDAALSRAKERQVSQIWVLGGERIYAEALERDVLTDLVLSYVGPPATRDFLESQSPWQGYAGDAHFPTLPIHKFRVQRVSHFQSFRGRAVWYERFPLPPSPHATIKNHE